MQVLISYNIGREICMYPIHFYKDRNGHEPVREYIETLYINSSKDSRIKLHKIQDYLTM